MAAKRAETDQTQTRPLAILGINEAEERAYRWLLTHSGATVSSAAQALSLSPATAQRLFDTIKSKGLVTYSPERPRRYIPASPDLALEALTVRHHENLRRVEMEIQKLQAQSAAALRERAQKQTVEVITSREAGRRIYDQLHRTARREVCSLVSPPILISRLDISPGVDGKVQREAQTRGVKYRSIADSGFLSLPGAANRIHNDTQAGEEYRVYPELPIKVTLVDRRVGFIPLKPKSKDFYSLLVRTSPLIDGLYALFEVLWERSCPVTSSDSSRLETGDFSRQLPEEAEELIALMAAGLNDKKIASELGISASTLKRRIAEIMRAFNVRTRFQLGRMTGNGPSGNH